MLAAIIVYYNMLRHRSESDPACALIDFEIGFSRSNHFLRAIARPLSVLPDDNTVLYSIIKTTHS